MIHGEKVLGIQTGMVMDISSQETRLWMLEGWILTHIFVNLCLNLVLAFCLLFWKIWFTIPLLSLLSVSSSFFDSIISILLIWQINLKSILSYLFSTFAQTTACVYQYMIFLLCTLSFCMLIKLHKHYNVLMVHCLTFLNIDVH